MQELMFYNSYAEIKHTFWLFKVTWLVLTNQSSLFLNNIATYDTLKFVYDIGSRSSSQFDKFPFE